MPTELAAEISSADAYAQQAWLEAREARDFGHFAPALERVLELQRRYIACFDGTGEFAHPYDILLDDYEPGLTTEELRGIFARLQTELVPLVSAAAAAGEDGHVFPGPLPGRAPARDGRRAAGRRRLRHRALAPRRLRAPLRAQHGRHRRAAHDALGGGRPRDGVLLLPARVRPRALRGPVRAAPLPHDARGGGRPRDARVAEPAVGEPGRPLAAVLRVGPAAAAPPPRRAVRGAGRRLALPRGQPGPARA